MKKEALNRLILECVNEHKLKQSIKKLVLEAIKEIKAEKIKSCDEMMSDLESDIKAINKEYSVVRDDAGIYNVNGCPPHMIKLNHMHTDKFDVTYYKDGSDRKKKISLGFDDVQKFVKEVLKAKEPNYVTQAYNKSAKNSEFSEGKEKGAQETTEKVEDAVTKKTDAQDAPMKSVDSIKKQVDHSIKGTKPDYTYPKQKDKKLVVKLHSKKQKTKKS
jgi:hypothetical protein